MPIARLARFGSFELDLATGELRKGGVRIKLQEQPFQVLIALLERPGEVVTREELRERLWPGDTFVEFDDGLNTAVRKIRQALGDSADNPRFVETLPRRGYRFVALAEGGAWASTETVQDEPKRPAPQPRPKRTKWYVSAAALLVAVSIALASRWGVFDPVEPASQKQMRLVPLTSYAGIERTPALSPNGEQVAFSWNGESQDNFDIYAQRIGSQTPPTRLTSHAGYDTSPAWSPDGRFIAFARTSDDPSLSLFYNYPIDCEVFVMSAIGGPASKVAETSHPKLAWLPDGKRLIGSHREAPGGPSALFVFSIDGTEEQPLTRPPSTSTDLGPAVSPDGRVVAFLRWPTRQLYTINTRNAITAKELAIRWDATGGVWNHTWSPRGDDLIVVMGPNSTQSTFSVSGRILRRLSPEKPPQSLAVPAMGVMGPDVSARGNRLVFTQHSWDKDLAILRRTGGGERSWETAPFPSTTRIEGSPHHSPDSKRIVFNSERASDNLDLWLSNADGSDATPLLDFKSATAGSARWSPDGQRIVFDSWGDGKGDILVMSASGGEPLWLTENPAVADCLPRWSVDGRWVYFNSERSETWEIWRISAAGGDPQQVTTRGGTLAMASPDGKYLYYLKDESLPSSQHSQLWRISIDGGEEDLVLERVYARNFSVTEDGVYFMERPEESEFGVRFKSTGRNGFTFRYLNLDSRKIRTLATLPSEVEAGWGFAVSPDEQNILYDHHDSSGADLMLVENFR